MNEAVNMSRGTEALARVLAQLAGASKRVEGGESPDAIAEAVWGDFRTAVAAAVAEMRESEAEGVARWQQARHGS